MLMLKVYDLFIAVFGVFFTLHCVLLLLLLTGVVPRQFVRPVLIASDGTLIMAGAAFVVCAMAAFRVWREVLQ